jgi:hypothetical protein
MCFTIVCACIVKEVRDIILCVTKTFVRGFAGNLGDGRITLS